MVITTAALKGLTRSWAASEVRSRLAATVPTLFLVWSAGCSGENAAPLTAGQCEQLMLAVDSHAKVTGYFHEQQGDAPAKCCAFFLAGKTRASGEIPIITWNDDVFAGTLTPQHNAVKLRIEHGREHPGCGLVLLPQIASGLGLDRVADGKWSELRRITQQRAHFHSAPDAASRERSFVVSGDVVGVLERRGEWLHAEYRGEHRKTVGWITTNATRELTAPHD